jgi:murein DD-endopeptidase MepM/ murein hydrolase activator NlpD
LSEIGVLYGVPFREITRLNNIPNPDKILVGQKLRIPQGGQEPSKTDLPQSEFARRRTPYPEPIRVAKTQKNWLAQSRRLRPTPKISVSLPKEQPPLPKGNGRFIWPAKGTLTSQYGPRNESFHDGIDIAAPVGTPVVAAAPGEVLYSGVLRGYGKVIIVRHGKGYASVYAHNSVNHVKQGQVVKQGQKLAEIGETGRATGPNLHFEIRRNNRAQNPLQFFPADRRIVSR